MNRSTLIFILINVCGGIAVLGSYAYGLLTQAKLRGQLWGAIPGLNSTLLYGLHAIGNYRLFFLHRLHLVEGNTGDSPNI